MNKKQTKKWLNSQIRKLNKKIDVLILAGKPYTKESAEHYKYFLALQKIDAH